MSHLHPTVALVAAVLAAAIGLAAEPPGWTPPAWKDANTVELRTQAAGEGEHWFPVWLVVLDDQAYVRLGSRAVSRIEKNTTAPYLGVRIQGQQFDRVKGVPAPEQTERVAKGMGEKYWSDVFVRYFDHPLTLRLEPEPAK